MQPPEKPKIYHIVHVDRLPAIITDLQLLSDADIARRTSSGTGIGMTSIKRRHLEELTLTSHPALHVGDCVPFYFCPRSVMLYVIHQANHPELAYRGGQEPIVHLEVELHRAVIWSNAHKLKWAFTLSNAGAYYFEDRNSLKHLDEIDWNAVQARDWRACKEGKQAEFLVEKRFEWSLVSRIGVHNRKVRDQVLKAISITAHKPAVEILPEWYY